MGDKLQEIIKNYESYQNQMMDPEISSDLEKMKTVGKKISDLEEIYHLAQKYILLDAQIQEAQQTLKSESDPEMIELAQMQRDEAKSQMPALEEQIKIALLPKDPNDDKNIFMEIRPAAGGDEAGLFANELLKAYLMYASKKGRRAEVIEQQMNDVGGLKFAMVKISGHKVYSILKYESGVHRVQRIPETESNGRVHTSTITVAIMPEVEDVQLHIDMKDIQMDTYAASSAGGQNANKNQTGVRLHHLPTGIIVTIGDSKSQLQNKEKAFAVLKSKLYQIQQEKKEAESRDLRGSQIGTGERSEKIKTYNFPQDRLTDHRIKKSRSNLPVIMMGELDEIINDVIVTSQSEMLGQSEKE